MSVLKPKTVDARGVANYLLARAEIDQRPLDQLKLQKLTYLAHGWHLGLSGEPLLVQEIHAWPYGPVIPILYDEFKRFGSGPVQDRARYYDRARGWCDFLPAFDPYSKSVVDAVWDQYGKFTGGQLITLTHQPGTPWAKVTQGLSPLEIRDIPIPNPLIREYYHALAIANQTKRG